MPALKDFLEGRPLGAPLHPALVHLPLALLPLSLLFDAASWLMDDASGVFVRAAFGFIVAGVLTGLLAAVFGMVDYTAIRDDHPARKTATVHMILNVIALGLYGASAGLRYAAIDEPRTAAGPLVVALAGLAMLSYSGYLGGHLVYADGIGVGRHRRKTRMPESTVRVTGRGMVPVGDASALGEGEIMRVDINGVVAAVARVGGRVFAFQEFCTHRFGPLSEGALRGHNVVCPWHNSCFDVQTGKVTHGPAKVDLRTFRTEVREGKIWISSE